LRQQPFNFTHIFLGRHRLLYGMNLAGRDDPQHGTLQAGDDLLPSALRIVVQPAETLEDRLNAEVVP
jgi:hypothetical protein